MQTQSVARCQHLGSSSWNSWGVMLSSSVAAWPMDIEYSKSCGVQLWHMQSPLPAMDKFHTTAEEQFHCCLHLCDEDYEKTFLKSTNQENTRHWTQVAARETGHVKVLSWWKWNKMEQEQGCQKDSARSVLGDDRNLIGQCDVILKLLLPELGIGLNYLMSFLSS